MSVDPGRLRHVRIVGSGLIGTSIGLALRKSGILVTMVDSNRAAATLAQDLMGQEAPSDASAALVDVVLIATDIPSGLDSQPPVSITIKRRPPHSHSY